MPRQDCKKNEYAFVGRYGVQEPEIVVVEGVREYLPEGHVYSYDPRLVNTYFSRGWDNWPEKPTKPGEKYNATHLSTVEVTEGTQPIVTLMRGRYNICLAQSTLFKDGTSAEKLTEISPRMMNVSIKGLIEINKKLYLPCHIRGGGTIGTGQLLLATGIGGMTPAHLESEEHPNPMVAALADTLYKKTGIADLYSLNPTFTWDQIVEPEVGRDNWATFSRGLDLEFLLSNLKDHNQSVLGKGGKIQVAGIGLVPFERELVEAAAAEEPEALKKISCYVFNPENPAEWQRMDFGEYADKQKMNVLFRPITWANFIKMAEDENYMPYFAEQCGFSELFGVPAPRIIVMPRSKTKSPTLTHVAHEIKELKIEYIAEERTPDHPTIVERCPELPKIYKKKGYDKVSTEEVEGQDYNGLQSSIVSIEEKKHGILVAKVMPTRYLVRKAFADFVQSNIGDLTEQQIIAMNPRMANSHLVVPVRYNDRMYILAHVKGKIKGNKVLGHGEIHSSLTSGNVSGDFIIDYLLGKGEEPFIKAAKTVAASKIGLDLNTITYSSPAAAVDEAETGQYAFLRVVRCADFNMLTSCWLEDSKSKPLCDRAVFRLALIPFDEPQSIRESVLVLDPDKEDWVRVSGRKLPGRRPITESLIDYPNLEYLLRMSGMDGKSGPDGFQPGFFGDRLLMVA